MLFIVLRGTCSFIYSALDLTWSFCLDIAIIMEICLKDLNLPEASGYA